MAHIAVDHCTKYPGARVCLARRAMPDLKSTIFLKVMEHLEGSFVEGVDYEARESIGFIKFRNGSEIISRSWADKKYKRFRSLELSGAVFEELTENNDEDKQAYDEIKARVGRLPHIKEKFIISATNPEGPSHWAYKYFIQSKSLERYVFYSVTTDNPFLPKSYIDQLLRDMDAKTAQRMIYGRWIELTTEVVYGLYDSEKQYLKDTKYQVKNTLPIHISFDFNIGVGKPMSLCCFQRDKATDQFHVFHEVVCEGMRTTDILDELADGGILDAVVPSFVVNGDAAGKHKDTRNIKSDYDIIRQFLSNYRTKDNRSINFEVHVPLANPPIRTRHNLVNAYCKNAAGQTRLFVYSGCKTVDEALRLTQLKKGANLIEDDSKAYQHVGTALGYGMIAALKEENKSPQGSRQL